MVGKYLKNAMVDPAEKLNENKVNMDKALYESQTGTEDKIFGTIMSLLPMAMSFMAYGGNTANTQVNAEDGEYVETPEGNAAMVKGNTHSQGGVNLNLPEGSDVFSNRIVFEGVGPKGKDETFAKLKEKAMKKYKRIEKQFKDNPTDEGIKNAFNRATEVKEMRDKYDKFLQEKVRDVTGKNETKVAAWGLEDVNGDPLYEFLKSLNVPDMQSLMSGLDQTNPGDVSMTSPLKEGLPNFNVRNDWKKFGLIGDKGGNPYFSSKYEPQKPLTNNLNSYSIPDHPNFTGNTVYGYTDKDKKVPYKMSEETANNIRKNLAYFNKKGDKISLDLGDKNSVKGYQNMLGIMGDAADGMFGPGTDRFNNSFANSIPKDFFNITEGPGKIASLTQRNANDSQAGILEGASKLIPKGTTKGKGRLNFKDIFGKAGNAVSMAGNLISTFAPYFSALKSAAGDYPVTNPFKNVAAESIAYIEDSEKGLRTARDEQRKDIDLARIGATKDARNRSRSVNDMAANSVIAQEVANKALSEINAAFATQISQFGGQKAQVALHGKQLEGQGDMYAQDARQMNKDANDSAMAEAMNSMGTGFQEMGKDLNAMKFSEDLMKMLPYMSKYVTWDGTKFVPIKKDEALT